jgi:hypothetical protein
VTALVDLVWVVVFMEFSACFTWNIDRPARIDALVLPAPSYALSPRCCSANALRFGGDLARSRFQQKTESGSAVHEIASREGCQLYAQGHPYLGTPTPTQTTQSRSLCGLRNSRSNAIPADSGGTFAR